MQGTVHLRPDENVVTAFRDKMAMQAKAQERYASIRDKTRRTSLDAARYYCTAYERWALWQILPSLDGSGAEGRWPVPNRTTIPDPQSDAANAPSWPSCIRSV